MSNPLPDPHIVRTILELWRGKGFKPSGIVCHPAAAKHLTNIAETFSKEHDWGLGPLTIIPHENDYDRETGTDKDAFLFYCDMPWSLKSSDGSEYDEPKDGGIIHDEPATKRKP